MRSVVLGCIFGSALAVAPGTLLVGSYGSLVVFVPTAEGLVVCADKREWNRVRGASDSETKIYPIAPNAAFTVTGTVAVLDPLTLQPVFSIKELAFQHLTADSTHPLVERIEGLAKALEDGVLRFSRAGNGRLERAPDSTDDVISSVTVWYVIDGRVRTRQAQLHEGLGRDASRVSYSDLTEQVSRKFFMEGQTEFILAAIRKSDPRFKRFKDDPDIRTVWTSSNAGSTSVDLGARFGRKVIRATSENHNLVSESPSLVSADCDCSLTSPARGFEWLRR